MIAGDARANGTLEGQVSVQLHDMARQLREWGGNVRHSVREYRLYASDVAERAAEIGKLVPTRKEEATLIREAAEEVVSAMDRIEASALDQLQERHLVRAHAGQQLTDHSESHVQWRGLDGPEPREDDDRGQVVGTVVDAGVQTDE